jgi:anti-sigma factor RsiW
VNAPERPDDITSTLCLSDASYVLGSLTPSERSAYEKHLTTCLGCQASVAELAGLPGLLAPISAADVDSDPPPVPELLLPNLLAAVVRERRRRRGIWAGTLVAAAACLVALVISVLVRPQPAGGEALPAPVAMQPLVPGPMTVSLQLEDKQWGTSVVVHCVYQGAHQAGFAYQLVAFDASGKPQNLGWWMSVAGSASTVTTASSLRLKEISHLEVQRSDGRALMTAVPG